MRIARSMPKNFLLLSGDDMQSVAMYAIGGKGVISVLANAYPQVFRRVKEYAFAGNFPKASAQLFQLLDINGSMYEEGNPVGIKSLLWTMGLCDAYVRLPLAPASQPLWEKIGRLAQQVKKNKG